MPTTVSRASRHEGNTMAQRPSRFSSRRTEHQAIILAAFAGMFAWVMQAALDYYFYAGRTYPEHLFLNVPPRELFSRLTILSAFLMAGFITSRMVRTLERANARARRLDDCVRTVRNVNQLITREGDREQLARGACETLVAGLGYDRVEINLADKAVAAAEKEGRAVEEDELSFAAFPISCADEVLGELVVSTAGSSQLDDEEEALLNEVSEDIGFAVRSIELGERLEQQREELETILDSVPAYITYKDTEGRYLRVNRAVADLAGVPMEAWARRRLSEIIPDAPEEGRAVDTQVIETGRPRRTAIGTLDFAPDRRWVQTDRIPYRDGSGETIGVITLSYDITDLMEAQRDLAIKEEQLRQS
ncbi:MAG: PAS domain-containing protein, partial [Candidatus Eisenbacteria bacterium]|nr:PAS domain-containing protein [Candidatus Eisenbacteria bacterium]